MAPKAPARKKLSRAELMFKDKTGETLIKKPGVVDGRAFIIKGLEDCKVYMYDHTAQVSQVSDTIQIGIWTE